ncbi:MAG: GntR family transcriptional regulator [Thermodesulfovibrionales bacterium]
MILIDRGSHQKLYRQLLEIIKGKIESGEWSVGSQIPTEEELCKTYDVSKATVRSAILELVRQGYLMRQQGKGTFINKSTVSEGIAMQTSLKELMFEDEFSFKTKVIAHTVMMPIDDLDIRLDISPDKHVIYIKRLYLIEDEAILVQETYIPYHVCPLLLEDNIEDNSLFDIVEKKYGIKITKAKNYIDITFLNLNESVLLGLNEGATALLLQQYFYSGDTQIMYTRSVKRIDRINFHMEFERRFA